MNPQQLHATQPATDLNGLYSTFCQTEDGTVYDIGEGQHPPYHKHPNGMGCPACLVRNAWTQRVELSP